VHLQFGNLPYGFRANTWLIPPIYVDPATKRPALPVEDENWGGDGGGSGRDGKYDRRRWSKDFSVLARMPCKTEEERVIRDRKAFLLHNLFVDTAIFRAASAIRRLINQSMNSTGPLGGKHGSNVFEERIGDMHITVKKDEADASLKLDDKVDGVAFCPVSDMDITQRNLLKGLTSDESVVVKVMPHNSLFYPISHFLGLKSKANFHEHVIPCPGFFNTRSGDCQALWIYVNCEGFWTCKGQ
jgi:protein TIF31